MEETAPRRRRDPRLQRLYDAISFYRTAAGILLLIALVEAAVIVWQARHSRFARAIRVDNAIACYVRNEAAAEEVRKRLTQELKGNLPGEAVLVQKWESLNWPLGRGDRVLSVPEAVALLKPKVTVRVSAAAITIGKRPVVYLPSRDLAQLTLDVIRRKYAEGPGKLVSSDLLPKDVAITEMKVPPESITVDVHEAATKLTAPREAQATYVVRPGDSWRRVADLHNMTVRQLRALNPRVGSILRVGDQLRVSAPTAPITVVTVREEGREVPYDAPPERVPSNTLPRGQTRVTIQAQPGKKLITERVTYRNGKEVSREPQRETVIVEARPERIMVGTAEP